VNGIIIQWIARGEKINPTKEEDKSLIFAKVKTWIHAYHDIEVSLNFC
jgi:hypothetical protein